MGIDESRVHRRAPGVDRLTALTGRGHVPAGPDHDDLPARDGDHSVCVDRAAGVHRYDAAVADDNVTFARSCRPVARLALFLLSHSCPMPGHGPSILLSGRRVLP